MRNCYYLNFTAASVALGDLLCGPSVNVQFEVVGAFGQQDVGGAVYSTNW